MNSYERKMKWKWVAILLVVLFVLALCIHS